MKCSTKGGEADDFLLERPNLDSLITLETRTVGSRN